MNASLFSVPSREELVPAATTLRLYASEIMEAWEKKVRAKLSVAQELNSLSLKDGLPRFLAHIADGLESGGDPEAVARLAKEGRHHALERVKLQTYSIEQITLEYRILRFVTLQTLTRDAAITPRQLFFIDASIDEGLENAIALFNELGELVKKDKPKDASVNVSLLEDIARLENTNADLDRFTGLVAHDLKSPLTTITLFSQLLIQRYGDSLAPEAHSYLDLVVENARRMGSLIKKLLDYAKVGSKALKFESVDCNEVLRETLQILEGSIQEKGAVIKSASLPHIGADRTLIILLFQNLIGNGIKYHGARRPLVRITADEEANSWKFTFKDNGIGIDPEGVKQLFRPFVRGAHEEEIEGSGLGLTICKLIVDNHGGTIAVDSLPGVGTSFFVTLPKRRVVS